MKILVDRIKSLIIDYDKCRRNQIIISSSFKGNKLNAYDNFRHYSQWTQKRMC